MSITTSRPRVAIVAAVGAALLVAGAAGARTWTSLSDDTLDGTSAELLAGADVEDGSAAGGDVTQEQAYADAFGIDLADVPAAMALDELLSASTELWLAAPGVANVEVVRDRPGLDVWLLEGAAQPTVVTDASLTVQIVGTAVADAETLAGMADDAVQTLDAAGIDAQAWVDGGMVMLDVAARDRAAALELLGDGPYEFATS